MTAERNLKCTATMRAQWVFQGPGGLAAAGPASRHRPRGLGLAPRVTLCGDVLEKASCSNCAVSPECGAAS